MGLAWALSAAGPRVGARPVVAAAPGTTREGRDRLADRGRLAARGRPRMGQRGGTAEEALQAVAARHRHRTCSHHFSGIAKRCSEHGGPTRSPDTAPTRPFAATARPPACGGEALCISRCSCAFFLHALFLHSTCVSADAAGGRCLVWWLFNLVAASTIGCTESAAPTQGQQWRAACLGLELAAGTMRMHQRQSGLS